MKQNQITKGDWNMSNRNRIKKKQKLNAERIRNALYELRDAGLISLNEGEKGYEVELKDPRPLVGYEHPSGAHCKKLYELPKCKIKII